MTHYKFLMAYFLYMGILYIFFVPLGFADYYAGTQTFYNETTETTEWEFTETNYTEATAYHSTLDDIWLFWSFMTWGWNNPFSAESYFAWFNIALGLVCLAIIIKEFIIPALDLIPFT